uniref:Fungal lipase-like domain-containing protein n=1 Tax=Triticum aestivum TaxID=4565 RepID=A0A3B6FM62_WHEAT
MGTATMATALGAAMLLYFVLSRRLANHEEAAGSSGGGGGGKRRRGRAARQPSQPPATWMEAVGTLAETLRFTYSETLGKWPIGDLAFGIKYLMRRQGNLHVAGVYAGSNCIELKGPEVMEELIVLRRLIDLCFLFSKKSFPVFLELAGFSQVDVLIEEPKAGILKPAHTILRDECTKSFLVLIRGTHSMKDTLTAVTGAVVPFHHSVLDEGGISKLVLGYAHCGMVAAARWIARGITPCLLQAITQCPEYQIKIVGHSLGGGTAALLTYILREHTEFSTTTCVAFAPASCMTWELAESGKHFITTIVNGADLVPTVSTASIDDLRSEVVMKQAQNVAQAVARSRSALSSWACMGARRRPVGVIAVSQDEMTAETHVKTTVDSESFVVEQHVTEVVEELQYAATSISVHEETEEEALMSEHETSREHGEEEITDGELWFEFDKDRDRQAEVEARTREEEAAAAKEIMEEESAVLKNVEDRQSFSSDSLERQQFYPPGRIMHMVAMPPPDAGPDDPIVTDECTVGLYGTPRHLYSKIRLSNTMINDHYMPMYKKMMEILIEKFANNDDNSGADSTVE